MFPLNDAGAISALVCGLLFGFVLDDDDNPMPAVIASPSRSAIPREPAHARNSASTASGARPVRASFMG